MIYEHVYDMDALVSLREAFLAMDEWTIDRVIRKRMRRILATSTLCIFSKNPAGGRQDLRVRLQEGNCNGEMLWALSDQALSKKLDLGTFESPPVADKLFGGETCSVLGRSDCVVSVEWVGGT